MIYGTFGRLGKGKTLYMVILAYIAYLEGLKVFSNIWLRFPHVPIRAPLDFLSIEKGFLLADELWTLVDNRKSMSLLSDVITIILLRSRKRKFNVGYTQQFMQIDCRIAYVTDKWIKPQTFPDNEYCLAYGCKPNLLYVDCADGDFIKLPSEYYENIEPYCDLYDTEKDPYTLSTMVSDKNLRAVLERIGEIEKKELTELTAKKGKGLVRFNENSFNLDK